MSGAAVCSPFEQFLASLPFVESLTRAVEAMAELVSPQGVSCNDVFGEGFGPSSYRSSMVGDP